MDNVERIDKCLSWHRERLDLKSLETCQDIIIQRDPITIADVLGFTVVVGILFLIGLLIFIERDS